MQFEKILQLGVEKEIISQEQKVNLLNLAKDFQQDKKESSSVVTFLYYLGGFIMFFAMFSLMLQTILNGTYYSIFALGTIYATIFLALGEFLWKKDEKLPAGIMYFLFITAFSLIFMDIEKMIGFFPHFSDIYKFDNFFVECRFPMITLSLVTILVNSFLIKNRSTSILAIPLIGCIYTIYFFICEGFLGLKILEMNNQITIHVIFSVILFAVAFWKDMLTKVDYSKWFYLFSCLSIFYSVWQGSTESNLSVSTCVLGVIFTIIGSLIQRKSITIIGLLSIIQYIFKLETEHITNLTIQTSAILITGLIMLCTGVLYNQNIEKITTMLENIFPEKIRKYFPRNRNK